MQQDFFQLSPLQLRLSQREPIKSARYYLQQRPSNQTDRRRATPTSGNIISNQSSMEMIKRKHNLSKSPNQNSSSIIMKHSFKDEQENSNPDRSMIINNRKTPSTKQNQQENDDFKQRELQYLLRIATLEKESQVLIDQVTKYKKLCKLTLQKEQTPRETDQIVQLTTRYEFLLKEKRDIEQRTKIVQEGLVAQKNEISLLKKQFSLHSRNTHSNNKTNSYKATTTSNTSFSACGSNNQKQKTTHRSSLQIALNLVQ